MEDSAATANRFKIYNEANKERILQQKREAYQKESGEKIGVHETQVRGRP